ncbi:MAG: hypothetical protein D6761_04485 [Candidatus Dadabacteria bacterium]|nr:MAG: hypothetical protein D6761_04485 [Candidatus Dadabacteria bacterium]
MTETTTTFCRICEALCGLEVDVDGGRIVDVRPDASHVATQGFACIKGLNQHRMYASPDRLRRPLRRDGRSFREVSWQEALTDIGKRVRRIRRRDPDGVAMYVGTAAGFSMLHPVFAQGFMKGIGSRSIFSTATQDCANKFAVATHIYGFPFIQPMPDIERTRLLIVVGANPVVSKWSFGQVPHPLRKLRAIRERGGRIVVVDPRRTETAKLADDWLPIRAGSDLAFYLSFLHELLRLQPDPDPGTAPHLAGIETVRDLAKGWPAERTAAVTGIDAMSLRALVRAFVETDAAALYSSTGVNMGGQGALCFWLQEAINAWAGKLDRPGGVVVGQGIIDFAAFGQRTGMFVQPQHSRFAGLPTVNDALPGGILADEILTPGKGQIRALFVTGGNPLLTMADSERLRRAFRQLDLLVTVDIYRNETGELADYILPATSPYERPDLPFAFPLLMGMQTAPYLQATRAVVPPPGEARDEATIYLDLARACGVSLFGSRIAQAALEAMAAVASRRAGRRTLPLETLLSGVLLAARQPSFGQLLRQRHGLRRQEEVAGTFLGQRIATRSGKIELAAPEMVDRARSIERWFAQEQRRIGELRLITRRHPKTHNSWTHNIEAFMTDRFRENHLYMHPEDAARLGLVDGQTVDVTSATATVRLPVELDTDLRPGTVALPHGWGHQVAPGLRVASRTAGVNVNLLAGSGAANVEPVSGMSRLTAIPVQVRPAAGPRNTASWSGI